MQQILLDLDPYTIADSKAGLCEPKLTAGNQFKAKTTEVATLESQPPCPTEQDAHTQRWRSRPRRYILKKNTYAGKGLAP